jgi:hypothetical protein
MNKIKVPALLISVLALSLLGACGAEKEGTAYGVINGNCIAKVDLKVKSGKVTACSIDETFMPCYWARINPDELASSGVTTEAIDVEIPLYSGASQTATVHIAKYISLGGYVYQGTLVDDAIDDAGKVTQRKAAGEYVYYMAVNATSAPTSNKYDLYAYVTVNSTSVNNYAKWYYNCIAGGQKKTASEKGTFAIMGYASGSTELTEQPYTPNFPGSAFKADVASTYWPASSGGLGWKGNIAKIESFLLGKELRSTVSLGSSSAASDSSSSANGAVPIPVIVQGSDSIWTVDGASSGATITNFPDYYQIADYAYASVEYASYGL